MPTAAPPHNIEAEEALLGAALLSRHAVELAVARLDATDFYQPAYGNVFEAIVKLYDGGSAIDAVTVADEMRRQGTLADAGGPSVLITLQSNTPAIGSAPRYMEIIKTDSTARRALGIVTWAREAITNLNSPYDVIDRTIESLENVDRGAGKLPERYWRSTAAYLAADKGEQGEPIIPRLIAPRGRTLVLATEKGGKSTLLRQFVECVASALHPWTFQPLPEPIPSLLLDVENDDDELKRTLPYLDAILSARLGPDRPRPALFSAPYALDLRSRRDRAALEEVLVDCRPKLIVGGPIVNFYKRRRGENEDEIISDLKAIFNDIRRRWGCALIIEHHSKSDRSDGLHSKGGQAWDAWTNATIGLYAKDGGAWVQAKHQHPPRGDIVWPKRFIRGTQRGDWPWIPSFNKRQLEDEPSLTDADGPQYEQEGIF